MNLGLTGKKAHILTSSQGLCLSIASKLCQEGADDVIIESPIFRFKSEG
jgi:hypothetical protein